MEEDKDVPLDELGHGILGYVVVIKDKSIPRMPNVVHTSREGEDSCLVQTSLPFGVFLEPTERAPNGVKMTRKLKLSLDTSPNVLGVGTLEEDMIMGFKGDPTKLASVVNLKESEPIKGGELLEGGKPEDKGVLGGVVLGPNLLMPRDLLTMGP